MKKNYFLKEIWRYPIKGFNGEKLNSIFLKKNNIIPGDREFALKINRDKDIKNKYNQWEPKRNFLQLLNYPEISKFHIVIDKKLNLLSIFFDDKNKINLNIDDNTKISEFFYKRLIKNLDTPLSFIKLNENGFTDNFNPYVSICGDASINEVSKRSKLKLENERFRINFILKTDKPFEEFSWIGKIITIGESKIRIVEKVGRCSAINIQPKTSHNKKDLIKIMLNQLGHKNLGVFGIILNDGLINKGDFLQI